MNRLIALVKVTVKALVVEYLRCHKVASGSQRINMVFKIPDGRYVSVVGIVSVAPHPNQ